MSTICKIIQICNVIRTTTEPKAGRVICLLMTLFVKFNVRFNTRYCQVLASGDTDTWAEHRVKYSEAAHSNLLISTKLV